VVLPVMNRLVGLAGRAVVRVMAPAVIAAMLGSVLVIASMDLLSLDALPAWQGLALALMTGGLAIGALTLLVEPHSRLLAAQILSRLRSRS
jgi:hypothetical protein